MSIQNCFLNVCEAKIHINFCQTQYGEKMRKSFVYVAQFFLGLDLFISNESESKTHARESKSKICMHIDQRLANCGPPGGRCWSSGGGANVCF
jgi:hypothetical protein